MAAWLAWALLLLYVKASSGDTKPFDPFEILGIERGATDKEIKKAYRKLSLQFHPDKVRASCLVCAGWFVGVGGLHVGCSVIRCRLSLSHRVSRRLTPLYPPPPPPEPRPQGRVVLCLVHQQGLRRTDG
jgi:hypothetical protein